MSWVERELGGLIRVRHGFAFRSQFFSNTGKHAVLTPGHFFEEGGFKSHPEKDRFYTGPIPERFVLPRDALIVAMTEQAPGLLGSCAMVPEEGRYLHNQRIGLVEITSPRDLDPGFVSGCSIRGAFALR